MFHVKVRGLLDSQDENGDGELGFSEFVYMLASSEHGGKADASSSFIGDQIKATLSELRSTWAQLDMNGDGA